jgi:hypothetical protein
MADEAVDAGRRRALGTLSTGVAAAWIADSAAASSTSNTSGAAMPLSDPTKLYARPPFEDQPQPWPALASKMHPRPDHGETSYKGSGRLLGRKALITGGDSGIGRAAAIAYAREGADVAINYYPTEEPDAQEVAKVIRDAGRKAVLLPGDLRDEAFCSRLMVDATRELGGLDILVNNAARQFSSTDLTKLTTQHLDDTFRTNVYAMFWLTRAALPHLKPGSSIINTTSVQAYEPSEDLLDYAATKAAIMNFSKGLAKQLAPKGIRVNAVAPGPFWTPLQVVEGGKQPGEVQEFGSSAPLGRPGQPVELAPVYVLLASGEASYVTGQVYAAVGGGGGP